MLFLKTCLFGFEYGLQDRQTGVDLLVADGQRGEHTQDGAGGDDEQALLDALGGQRLVVTVDGDANHQALAAHALHDGQVPAEDDGFDIGSLLTNGGQQRVVDLLQYGQSRGAADQLYNKIMTEVVASCNKLEVDQKC